KEALRLLLSKARNFFEQLKINKPFIDFASPPLLRHRMLRTYRTSLIIFLCICFTKFKKNQIHPKQKNWIGEITSARCGGGVTVVGRRTFAFRDEVFFSVIVLLLISFSGSHLRRRVSS